MMRGAPLRVALFALLAANALIYAAAGRLSEGFDALAWYALLLLYECETRWPLRMRREPFATVAGLLRLAAGAAVVYAAAAFVHEREWLDALNAWLWIGVVIVLELEVRMTESVARHRVLATRASYMLYAALAGVALTWLVQGEWFDAYDAALWIAAFALIELELMPDAAKPA
ncbi:MAG: hypothetical protein ACO3F9_05130 [Burkholderiales bacterium]